MKGTQGFGTPGIRAGLLETAIIVLLGACSSGGGGDSADSAWVGDIESSVTVSGSVGDGPAANASVTIRTNGGEEVAALKSDASGSYNVDLKISKRHFPLLIDATGGTDIVTDEAPDFVMRSAVLSPGDHVTANINPFSTLAYEIAKDLNGGLTRDNLLAAEDIVVAALNSGLATLANAGPMRTPIDGSNVTEIIKASETLAEIVRRTRDALNDAGQNVSAEDVIEALGSDLIDTVIEGNGGARADSRVSAVAIVATAQVLLESMQNELHVNGVDATENLRRAIGEVVPEGVQPSIDELGVTSQSIDQARTGLSAAYAVTDDIRIFELMQALDGVQAGMEPALVRTLIPADYRTTLDGLAKMIASGDGATVNAVNAAARDGDTSEEENRAPVVSGQPATSVRAGSRYDFTPVASDLDGDPLTFSIENRPGWATFDAATGRLHGVPQASDAGTYEGITITVSDGSLTSSLGPFTIAVAADNAGPTISGTPATAVMAGERYAFTPTVTDPDSNVFRFSIAAKPAWADFDVVTGELTGTPTSGDVGFYRDIVISVTDGESNASLPKFSIEVVASGAVTGSVTLNWTPPTENEDGSPLLDLAGYRLYWGQDAGVYTDSVTINNPGVTRYIVDNLAPGSYEFVATAFNESGVESRFSNAVVLDAN